MRKLLLALLVASLSHAAETYVVAAGVEQYDDSGISTLAYAATDAKTFAEALQGAGVPAGNIKLYTSDATDFRGRPTRSNLLRALQWGREMCRPGDTLIFLFSGHGIQQGDEAYLLTIDSNRDLLNDTALSSRLIPKALDGFQGAHLLLIVDACRNNPAAGKGGENAALDERFAKAMRPRLDPAAASLPEPAVLLACAAGERAWEMPEQGSGALVYWLLRGLTGEAGVTDGGVKLSDLAAYVQREVPAWARRARQEQHPTFANPGADFALPKVPRLTSTAAPAAPVTPTPAPAPAPPLGARPANWPEYLSSYQPPAGMSWSSFRVSPKDGMPQVLIGAGEFLMGSPASEKDRQDDEGPQKRVYVSAFWMDLHEVTNEQFARFVKAAGYTPSPEWEKWSRDTSPRHPVVCVSWDDASAYAMWAGRHLPTEAEWERAARGGSTTIYPWGDHADQTMANGTWTGFRQYSPENAVRYTKPVCSFPANRSGLLDMIGNVYEWCRDYYVEGWYAMMPGQDPCNTQHGTLRVYRGGSWLNLPVNLRVADRDGYTPVYRYIFLGFRCSEAP